MKVTSVDEAIGVLQKAIKAGSSASFKFSALMDAIKILTKNKVLTTFVPILELVFRHRGKPYSIYDHFPFEPFFSVVVPPNMVIKSGRQVSKCRAVFDDAPVTADNGRPLYRNDLRPGIKVLGLNNDGTTCVNTICDIHHNFEKSDIYHVKTYYGSEFFVTEEHLFWSGGKWRPAYSLRAGDPLTFLVNGGCFKDFEITEDVHSAEVKRACYRLDKDARLPSWIFNLSYGSLKTFVKKLWTSCGEVFSNRVEFSSPSQKLIRDVRAILNKLGFVSRLTKSDKNGHNVYSAIIDTEPYLTIFLEEINDAKQDLYVTHGHLSDRYTIDDYIVSTEKSSCGFSWDIEVSGNNSYILDSIVTHNSTSLASRGILFCALTPYFTTLYVTPLHEQVRRLSNQYIKRFIEESPIKEILIDNTTDNSVLYRSFKNFSSMFFSFANLSADRIRGISADCCQFDEFQDIDPDHLPLIQETMSHSQFGPGISVYAGTPKTIDNGLEGLWSRSSQAEWCIPCPSCKYLNVPSLSHDIVKMIGPYHDGIGPLRPTEKNQRTGVPGTVCAKCGHWICARQGRWVHKYPERRFDYPGYHIPQVIMPIHTENPLRWRKLIAKMNGAENFTQARFTNEVLGESCDVGTKLVSKTDLEKAACLPWKNKPTDITEQVAIARRYPFLVMGVDWGGGGESAVSFTTAAIVGLTGSNKLDVIYGRRLLMPNNPIEEAVELLSTFNKFGCRIFAHDYNGAGNLREVFMTQSGLPMSVVMPFVYQRTAKRDIITYHSPADPTHHRAYWILDKARALQYVCELIKLGHIRFFQYDYQDSDNPGLINDFLALIENKVETRSAGDIYTITKAATAVDDFVHAVTFACCAIWHTNNSWPNIAKIAQTTLSEEQLRALGSSAYELNWAHY